MNRRLRWNDAPTARGTRASDANAGAPNERGVPTAGGINPEEESFDQGRRRVRLRGRDDETGESWGAELWLPQTQGGYGAGKPGDRKTGDAVLRGDLSVTRDGWEQVSALAAWQAALDRHYGQ
jgi:hypothetical protein